MATRFNRAALTRKGGKPVPATCGKCDRGAVPGHGGRQKRSAAGSSTLPRLPLVEERKAAAVNQVLRHSSGAPPGRRLTRATPARLPSIPMAVPDQG